MKKISCKNLLEYIPDELLENLEQQTKVNVQVKKLRGKIFFRLLLYSLLNSERVSLRVMEELWNSHQFKAFSGADFRRVKHSGIADRLDHIDPSFFQEIFTFLSQKFEKEFRQKTKSQRKQINCLKFDSTLVSLSSNLIKFGIKGLGCNDRNKSKKKQIKYTIGVKNLLPSEVDIYTKQSELSEEIALKETILKSMGRKDSIVVFDRGLQRRRTLRTFSKKKIVFITRLRKRIAYQTIRKHKEVQGRKTKGLTLNKDLIIQLKDETNKFMQTEFRLIVGTSNKTGELLYFLTNNLDLNAREITDLYRERWSIEVFFRFIKQELNFKHFVSRSQNGIQVMLYMTLITSILLLIYKEKNKISGYKIAKLRFALELEMEIIKDIVLACNGDISFISNFKKRVWD